MVDEATLDVWDRQDERIRRDIEKLNEKKQIGEEKDETRLSKHSEKRLKQRAGLSRSSAKKCVKQVLKGGFKAKEFKGSLRRYLDRHLYHENSKKGVNLFVHNYYVYVVDTITNTVITMWHLPPKYRRVYDAQKKKTTNNDK